MDDWIDSIPKLNCPITNCDETLGAQQPLLEVVVEGDGVEHPRLAVDCQGSHSFFAHEAVIFAA